MISPVAITTKDRLFSYMWGASGDAEKLVGTSGLLRTPVLRRYVAYPGSALRASLWLFKFDPIEFAGPPIKQAL